MKQSEITNKTLPSLRLTKKGLVGDVDLTNANVYEDEDAEEDANYRVIITK